MAEREIDRETLERWTSHPLEDDLAAAPERDAWLSFAQLLDGSVPAGDNEAIIRRLNHEIQLERRQVKGAAAFGVTRLIPYVAVAASVAIAVWVGWSLDRAESPELPVPVARPIVIRDMEFAQQIDDIQREAHRVAAIESSTVEFISIQNDIDALSESLASDPL